MNGAEHAAGGQSVVRRLPSPELRQAIVVRLGDVRRALLPLGRAGAERDRAGRAVAAMLSGWINAKVADPAAKVAGYVTVLADLPCWVIEQVCQDVARGHVEGLDPAYPPSAAQLHQLAEEALERLRKEQHDLLVASTAKLAAEPAPTEEERLRIGTQLIDLRDELQARERGEDSDGLRVKAEQNTTALAVARARVAAEYAAAGMAPPSPLALSLTARRAMAAVDRERTGHLPVDEQAKQAAE